MVYSYTYKVLKPYIKHWLNYNFLITSNNISTQSKKDLSNYISKFISRTNLHFILFSNLYFICSRNKIFRYCEISSKRLHINKYFANKIIFQWDIYIQYIQKKGMSQERRQHIEFTEDAIRNKIELSPIEKYQKYGNITDSLAYSNLTTWQYP